MSKILNDLNAVTQSQKLKYTRVLDNRASDDSRLKPADPLRSAPGFDVHRDTPALSIRPSAQASGNGKKVSTITLDKTTWYLSMVCVAFMGLVALILSFKAFGQIQVGNSNVIHLGKIITRQSEVIKALNASVVTLKTQTRQDLSGLETGVESLNQQSRETRSEVSQMGSEMSVVNVRVRDIEVTQQGLLNKYIDLSNEVRLLKRAQARVLP